jgi:hypothetical protein
MFDDIVSSFGSLGCRAFNAVGADTIRQRLCGDQNNTYLLGIVVLVICVSLVVSVFKALWRRSR